MSKTSLALSDAAASVFVISHDDIIRSGATTLPEMLRLAPNLQIVRVNDSMWEVTARGFNVANNASQSNKLLVLIDGRTVYTPLFAGVYWDMQEVLPDDIDRIEVISGPAGTLYGANAVNGVINVISRHSLTTTGGTAELRGGNDQRGGGARYGGRAGEHWSYRVYGQGDHFSPARLPGGGDANDAWTRMQGGVRVDWNGRSSQATVQGDAFQASEQPGGAALGRNVNASWNWTLPSGSSLFTQAYYDMAQRTTAGGGSFQVDTYDASVQGHAQGLPRQDLVWGGGDRMIAYRIHNTSSLLFQPPDRTLNIGNVFAQDTVALTPALRLVLGLKLEAEPLSQPEPLPTVRVAWNPTLRSLFWVAASRAVRAPTPVDQDLIERIGAQTILFKSFDFHSETLRALEAGVRAEPLENWSFSLTAFHHEYDSLRSIQPTPGTFLPLGWANGFAGRLYGLEGWTTLGLRPWWRVTAGGVLIHEHLYVRAGSADVGGLGFVADDPHYRLVLRSSMDLGSKWSFDALARYVDALPHPQVPSYGEVNLRLGWNVAPAWVVALVGQDLLHARHREFSEPGNSDEIPRTVRLDVRWQFLQ